MTRAERRAVIARDAMAHRLRAPVDPVRIVHDGVEIAAERGEPLAVALLAADRVLLARSPKLHRPRGPYCLRGACDGCLARVDGVPNVMTCAVPARGGERVETQNVLGSRGVDLLAAADFLFPRGIDHHRLLAGVRGVSGVVQRFARRVAGLGRLPEGVAAPRPARREDHAVLVVGGGAAGLAAAGQLGPHDVVLADDGLEPGGARGLLDPGAAERLRGACAARLLARTTVAGIFREPEDAAGRLHALLVGPEGAALLRVRHVIVAAGTHDAAPDCGDNDLPGVMSARAGLALWRRGVAPGRRLLLAGDGRFSRTLELAAAGSVASERVEAGRLLGVVGRRRVGAARIRTPEGERRVTTDAVLVDGPGAPAFELAAQVGARVRHMRHGFVPVLDERGLAAPGVWCAGSGAGTELDSADDGARVARHVAAML